RGCGSREAPGAGLGRRRDARRPPPRARRAEVAARPLGRALRAGAGLTRVPNLVELLRELVEIESPTGDTAAMRNRMEAELRALGFDVVRNGDHLVADRAGDGAPLLLLGHVDTVWPRGTLERMPWRVEDGRAYGPGSYDMKGGLVVLLEAARRAETGRA